MWRLVRDRYAALDPRSLGLFRIAFGCALIADLLGRVPVLVPFYTDDGLVPASTAMRESFSLLHAFSSPTQIGWAFAATAAVYLCYLVGFHTRAAQVASLLLVTSLHARSPIIEGTGDLVMNLLALWTVFLPLGSRFSVDAVRASLRAHDERTAADLNDRSHPAPPALAPHVSLACLAVLLQLAVIYAKSAAQQTGAIWRDGTAIHYLLNQERVVSAFGVACRQHLPLFVLALWTWTTLVITFAAPVLLALPIGQRRARWALLVSVWCLHVGIGLSTNLRQLQATMMTGPLILLGAADWSWLGARHRRRTGALVLIYDGTCGICHASARLLKRMDPLGQIDFHSNDEPALPRAVSRELAERTAVVIDPASGRTWIRAAAFAKVFRVLPGWAPLGWVMQIPGLAQLLGFAYDLFARNRHRVSAAFGLAACGVAPPAQTVEQRASGDRGLPHRTPFDWTRLSLREAAVGLLLIACTGQYVRRFALVPVARADGILVVDGVTADGTRLDPLNGDSPRFEVAPPRGRYPMSPSWSEYVDRIHRPEYARHRDGLRTYLTHQHLVAFDVYWLSRSLPAPGQSAPSPLERQRILSYP